MTQQPLPVAPGFQFRSGEQVSPEDSKKIVEGRKIDESAIYDRGVHPAFSSGSVEGPASIVELARALNNDPQKIYQWVHDNIDWEPGWGVQKGGLGCLLDGLGNAFDQSMLMVALLRQAIQQITSWERFRFRRVPRPPGSTPSQQTSGVPLTTAPT